MLVNCYIFFEDDLTEAPMAFRNELDILLDVRKDKLFFMCLGGLNAKVIGPRLHKELHNSNSIMSVESFFQICKNIRKDYELIKKEDFVVFLTSKKNNRKLISATDGKNIFINIVQLAHFSADSSKYPIAYQILENIFQALNSIVYHEGILEDTKLHKEAIGCINDVCINKEEFLFKMRRGYICKDCNSISKKNIKEEVLNSIKSTLEIIRNHNPAPLGLESNDEVLINVSDTGEIKIKSTLVNIETKPKAYFLFFLLHPEGVTPVNLSNYIQEIANIYQLLKKKGNMNLFNSKLNVFYDSISKDMKRVRNIGDPGFIKIISTAKESIKILNDRKIITKELADLMIAKVRKDGHYRIDLEQSKIRVHENFSLLSKSK